MNPKSKRLLSEAYHAKNSEFLEKLLKKGFKPGEYENSGTPLIQTLLASMNWYFNISHWDIWRTDRNKERNLDTDRSRVNIKMIHVLAKHGAKWLPKDRSERKSVTPLSILISIVMIHREVSGIIFDMLY